MAVKVVLTFRDDGLRARVCACVRVCVCVSVTTPPVSETFDGLNFLKIIAPIFIFFFGLLLKTLQYLQRHLSINQMCPNAVCVDLLF